MAKNPKIELLQRQIDAAKDLDLAKLLDWRLRSENALRFTVDAGSPALRLFRTVQYDRRPGITFTEGPKDPNEADRVAALKGVDEAIRCIELAIDELALWDEYVSLQSQKTDSSTEP